MFVLGKFDLGYIFVGYLVFVYLKEYWSKFVSVLFIVDNELEFVWILRENMYVDLLKIFV